MSDAKKLTVLHVENSRLKWLQAEQIMDVSTLKEMLGKTFEDAAISAIGPRTMDACSRRNAVTSAMNEKRYNQKRACAFAGIDARVYRRVSKRPADTQLRD